MFLCSAMVSFGYQPLHQWWLRVSGSPALYVIKQSGLLLSCVQCNADVSRVNGMGLDCCKSANTYSEVCETTIVEGGPACASS